MKTSRKTAFFVFTIFTFTNFYPQSDSIHNEFNASRYTEQKDIIDLLKKIFGRTQNTKKNTSNKKERKIDLSFLPAFGYSLQTKFAALISANVAFNTEKKETTNLSVISTYPALTQNRQIIFPILSTIWTKGNKYNFVGDYRFYKYPEHTYGLGSNSSLAKADAIDYSYLAIHQQVFKAIYPDFFIGSGYNLDYHYDIIEFGYPNGSISDFQKYGKTQKSVSSGLTLNFLYDSRRNPINPLPGFYSNIIYLYNTTLLGSDQNWQSLILDLRKYFGLPKKSKNILAFWSYTWLTFGKPPYLDLPKTAWDSYSNLGRGYIQSRFTGPKLLYLETEYRFVLTKNGLLGGVVFGNLQSVSEWPTTKFQKIFPAGGFGIRVKINKNSNTNISVDYGFGIGGSNGIFINLGEVF